jgi:small multidrug resistance pump
MNPYLLLSMAIGAEVIGTLALKAAEGMTRPGPIALVVLGFGTAFWLMSTSMDLLPVAVVYAIWSGLGMVGTAIGGVLIFGEHVGIWTALGIVLIGLGVTVLAANTGTS